MTMHHLVITGTLVAFVTLVFGYHQVPDDLVPSSLHKELGERYLGRPERIMLTTKSPALVKIEDKVFYIASKIDSDHNKWLDFLDYSYRRKGHAFTAEKIESAFAERMKTTLKKHEPAILQLVDMVEKNKGKEKEKVAKELAKHFAQDHVAPLMEMVVKLDENKTPPSFFDATVDKIAKQAMNNVYKLFNISLGNL